MVSCTSAVVKNLENSVYLVYGVTREMICGNSSQFRSRELPKLTTKNNMLIKFSPNRCHRAKLSEKVNRIIKIMPSKSVTSHHRTWDEHLLVIGCAIRTANHDTAQMMTYFMIFGRNMFLSPKDSRKAGILYFVDGAQESSQTRNESFRKMVKNGHLKFEKAKTK